MGKRIIGVHGLANKPEEKTLKQWWLGAMNEGLEYFGSGSRVSEDQFELIYWADLMYVRPQAEDEPDDSPFKLVQTYQKTNQKPKRHDEGFVDWARSFAGDTLDNVLDRVDFLDAFAGVILQLKMKDLATYWNEIRALDPGRTTKDVLCDTIRSKLQEHQGDEVMLISHSMGTIISLDTLIENSGLEVAHMVTMGSPLGLPRVKRRFAASENRSWPAIPGNIGQWTNFSDHGDPVCGDPFLKDDYRTEAGKKIIRDDIVTNEYEFTDIDGDVKSNCHKSYGYLRCPEVSRCINDFL